MIKHYKDTEGSPDFPTIEKNVLKYWKENDTFQKSIKSDEKEYIFYDGPPFANGLPHYGHLLTSCVKDIFARYHTMKGEKVERRFGWDCHGLPAEMGAEKELGVSGRAAIEEFGIDKFNDHCRTSVMKYTDVWQDYINRAARWVDFENDYKTMDKDYMESVIWAFKELYEKGLVYESHRVMPYSWAAQTPLSNFETRMDDAYRDRVDKAVTVAFKLREVPEAFAKDVKELSEIKSANGKILNSNLSKVEQYKILAWTTTPWTLPSNLALGVSEKMSYRAYLEGDTLYFASEEYIRNNNKKESEFLKYNSSVVENEPYKVEISCSGSELLNLEYEPLFPYFKDTPNAFKILPADFIEEGSGTGIVHLAPGFGEDDQRVCAENGIGVVCPVDEAGRFTDEIRDIENLSLKGLNVIADKNKSEDEPYTDNQLEKNGLANLRIITYLKQTGQLIKSEDYTHSYPHCWRTDTPLIYKAVPSWYVEVTKFRDRMVDLNQNINWIPDHIKDGQFGKWLENARDWSISRNRYWGCPIPIWRTPSGKIKVFGSIEELEEFFETKVNDLHRPFIDTLTKEVDGEIYTRVSDVFDCWFESGSMPFAQVHYIGEGEKPPIADFIVEYVGQTRGWFYTLMVLSTALFDREPFKNCICHGVILDTTGKKLSKKLRNYPDPNEMFDKYGADAMRWRMIKEPVMHGGNLLVSKDGSDIRDVVRLSIKPIWNAYHFFTLYANMDEIRCQMSDVRCQKEENLMDGYILAKLKQAVETIEDSLGSYDTPRACQAVDDFFEVLNNWYIRRSRDRFWREANAEDTDKQAAYDTLYTVLTTMCRAAAPLLPLITEEIYKGLTGESVHLQEFPNVKEVLSTDDIATYSPKALAGLMDHVRDACNAGLAIRNDKNIRVRQPLRSLTIVSHSFSGLGEYKDFKNLIQDEVNVKDVTYSKDIDSVATLKLKINFPVAGKRLGAKMKEVAGAAGKGEWKDVGEGRVEVAGEILESDEFEIKLEVKKGIKGAQVLSTNDAVVILDLEITPELEAEGIARDVVRFIQQSRKDAGLEPSDRINLIIETSDEIKSAVKQNSEYVTGQTLTVSLEFSKVSQEHVFETTLGDQKVKICFL